MPYPVRIIARNNLVSSVEHLDVNRAIQGAQVSYPRMGVGQVLAHHPPFGDRKEKRSVIKIRERELELKLRKATAERGGFCLKFTPVN